MTTDQADLDLAIAELAAGSERWAATTLAARGDLLTRVAASVAAEAEPWVLAAAHAKRLDPASPLIGEEWLTGPYGVLTSLTALKRTLRVLSTGRSPIANRWLGRAPGGRVTVSVLPYFRTSAQRLGRAPAARIHRPGLAATGRHSGTGPLPGRTGAACSRQRTQRPLWP
ncbi:hypothetical protein [Cryobacterium sp. Y62]|uniref:hypothetical protein n=1 Tax=Cryobacterium sp. Y62 TaxID=2048284 RepID=UPI001E4C5E0F|nr:hypothetical protein [Cryobacterium sp. Y62]